MTRHQEIADFYDILNSNTEEVFFFYKASSSDGAEVSHAVIDLHKIIEDPAAIKQEMAQCSTIAEKLEKNCSFQSIIPKDSLIDTYLCEKNSGKVARRERTW